MLQSFRCGRLSPLFDSQGENGNGKTTLLKLMLGELQPTEGEVRRNPFARIALVNQHHADQVFLDCFAIGQAHSKGFYIPVLS